MATTRRTQRYDSTGVLGDMEYLASSGLWVPVSGSKTVGYVPTIQGDGTIAFASPPGGSTPAEVLITETIVGVGGAASVSFSSISSSYRDLRVILRGRGDTAATFTEVLLRFNSDTGANYDYDYVSASGASATNNQSAGATSIQMGGVPAASAPSGVTAFNEYRIYDYRGTTFQKVISGNSGIKLANSTNNLFPRIGSGWWRSTAAITSITYAPAAGNFVQGTIVSLYGIL